MKRIMSIIMVAVMLTFSLNLTACDKDSDVNAVLTTDDGSERIMSYGKYFVTESMYRYWVSNYKRNILSSIPEAKDNPEFWEEEQENGVSFEKYYNDIIQKRVMNYLVSRQLFDEYGLTLSKDTVKKVDADIAEKIDFYGGEEELSKALADLSVNTDILRQIYLCEEIHSAVYNHLYGQGGLDEADGNDIKEYYEKFYSRIQYIVFYKSEIKKDAGGNTVYDNNGNAETTPLTGEKLQKLMDRISECQGKLDYGADFIEMIKEYSEYSTVSNYPNGFFVSKNELSTWGEGIVNGAERAHEGEVFRVDEDEAVYIVLKGALTPFGNLSDKDLSQLTSLNSNVSKYLSESKYGSYHENIETNDSVLARNSLSAVRANPHYSI